MSEPLPQLLDCRRIMAETGLTRAGAEKLMRSVPTVKLADLRKVYARRSDVLAEIERRTFSKSEVVVG